MYKWEIPGNSLNEKEITAKIGIAGYNDLLALDSIIQAAERYGIVELVTTEDTLDELYAKSGDAEGDGRFQFGLELFSMWKEIQAEYPFEEDFTDSTTRAKTWLEYGVFDFLKDSNDRRLIASAMASHCKIFLTMDYRTILPRRRRIAKLTKLEVLRPIQYWNRIKHAV